MDDTKKRRVRRKRKPSNEDKKAQDKAAIIKEVVEPIMDETDATQRLLDIQNKVKVIDRDIFQSLYGHWGGMPIKHIERMAKADNITAFERMTAARMVLAMKPETKNGERIGNFIEERYAGKATQRVEHSGVDGGPINFQKQVQEEIAKHDKFLDQMSDEELEEYERSLEFERKMIEKYGKKSNS